MASRRWWLCGPPVVFALVDYSFTMSGQLPRYWAGDHGIALEENPLVFWTMAQHPYALHVLTFLWIATFGFAILKLSRFLAQAVSLSVTFCHAFGAASWLFPVAHGYYMQMAICISSAVLFVAAVELSREEA